MTKNKVVLVTGGSRGIGRSISLMASAEGWAVGVNYTSGVKAADEVVSKIETGGGKAIAVKVDISEEAAPWRADGICWQCRYQPSPLELGRYERRTDDAHLLREHDRRLHLRSRGARRMAVSQGGQGGAIVNISSVAARMVSPNEYVDYAGSKAAIDAMTLGLTKERGPERIRVNVVRPSLIETEIHVAAGHPDRIAGSAWAIPLGRTGSPDEVAQAVAWLLSDKASYVNGALVDIGGGR